MLKQRLLAVEQEKFLLRQQVAKMAAALQKSGAASSAVSTAPKASSSPSPGLSAADIHQINANIKQEFEDLSFSVPSPQNTLDPRSSFSSPTSSPSRSPSPSHMDFNGIARSSDMTQHPAAMLCGLQCQSEAVWRPSPSPSSVPGEAQSPLPQLQQMRIRHTLTTLHLFLTLRSAIYSSLLQPISQLLTSLKTGLPMRTSTMTPTLFHLILWLISTPINPLTSTIPTTSSLPLTNTTSTTKTTSTSSPVPRLSSVFRTSLLRRLLACSPALARPLKDATGRALQMKTSHALRGNTEGQSVGGRSVKRIDRCEDHGSRTASDARCYRSQQEARQLMMVALVIHQTLKQGKAAKMAKKAMRENSHVQNVSN